MSLEDSLDICWDPSSAESTSSCCNRRILVPRTPLANLVEIGWIALAGVMEFMEKANRPRRNSLIVLDEIIVVASFDFTWFRVVMLLENYETLFLLFVDFHFQRDWLPIDSTNRICRAKRDPSNEVANFDTQLHLKQRQIRT